MSTGILSLAYLGLRFDGGRYGLSARRLWEYTELGQINPYGRSISARRELNDAAAFIDVVQFQGNAFSLAGFTLADLAAGHVPANAVTHEFPVLLEAVGSQAALAFRRMVADHLSMCSMRQATRNQHRPFLPLAQDGDVFGVPHIFSALRRRLQAIGKTKAGADQWFKTVDNMQKKGLRAEELERSGLMDSLLDLEDNDTPIPIGDLVDACGFESLRLSVMPVVNDAKRQLRFGDAPSKKLRKTRRLAGAPVERTRTVVGYDRVLGYRLERVTFSGLWGTDLHFQAVTNDGQVIRNELKQAVLSCPEYAEALAVSHAKERYPKRSTLGRWSHWSWSGGQDYREWLITLPFHPASFFSSHFSVRNILAHVRCDVRSGANSERVLLLHEVQSDWAQIARRKLSAGDIEPDSPECPPFMKEWPALAMKLVLLHAAHQGLDAVAWTKGTHQATRWKGLGATGLTELYDRTLPKEVSRMVKPFGGACEMLEVYVPTNFRISQSENGYDVYAADNKLLGTAPTLEDARAFLPDGAHERLYEVHGVRLPDPMRTVILADGFPAWG